MPRPEKVAAVTEIKERLEEARAVFLAEYTGLSVKAQQELRRGLKAEQAEFKVVKMTLARRAAADLDIDGLDDLLVGPTGVAFADGDPVGPAKVLRDFAKAHEAFAVKGGLLGGDVLTPERIGDLAEIEPREVLLARLAGAMKAPMADLAGALQAVIRDTASVIQQLLEARSADAATGESPGSDGDPSEEEPAADAAQTEDSQTEDSQTEDSQTEDSQTEDSQTEDSGAGAPTSEASGADDDDDDDAAATAEEE